jgi:hypothetical protein
MRGGWCLIEWVSVDDVRVRGSIVGLVETGTIRKKTEKLRFQSHWILVRQQAAGLVLIGAKGRGAESPARLTTIGWRQSMDNGRSDQAATVERTLDSRERQSGV